MPDLTIPVPGFNLWTEPWITLVGVGGGTEQLGLEQCLLRSHEFAFIYETSPTVVASIHRLLVAILQAAIKPQRNADLENLWQVRHFPEQAIRDFGKRYAERFDLFSVEAPFLQSADLPLQPGKGDKTVAYLAPEIPAATAITHYRHGAEDAQAFCPACAGRGLVCIPAFATSGGSGIKPSINGVPPIYILPGGRSLFESLASSLLRPAYFPKMASMDKDQPWWDRQPIVQRGKEVREVGYLYSLTFPARRVRLHPEKLNMACTRCGSVSEWLVRTMVFEMGECRPKEAEMWLDPFAAYRWPEVKGKDKPNPIRPVPGKALWREFAGLFLQETKRDGGGHRNIRPAVLGQIAELSIDTTISAYPFRCIGIRTDMKAKVFEWIDAGFEVPPLLLRDETVGGNVQEAIGFAQDCAGAINSVFREAFGGESKKSERNKVLRAQMNETYWSALAFPFRQFVSSLADVNQTENKLRLWIDTVIKQATASFIEAADRVGDDAEALRKRMWGERICNYRLSKLKEKSS